MSVDIEALVRRLGDSYESIYRDGLIPYKTKPLGDGDYAELDMRKEGVFLAFEGEEKIVLKPLKEIILTLIPENMSNGWKYPNKMPFGLEQVMTDVWLHKRFGDPIRQTPEKQIIKAIRLGRMEVFVLPNLAPEVVLLARYDLEMKQHVKKITFKTREDLEKQWKI